MTGRKMSTGHTWLNLVRKNIRATIRLIKAPVVLVIHLSTQPLGFSRSHLSIMPVWDRVNGMNTPTAYSGIRCSVCPSKAMIRIIDNAPRLIIPFE
ncbi:hypothetical protein D3C85_1602850 [compost metagenome]